MGTRRTSSQSSSDLVKWQFRWAACLRAAEPGRSMLADRSVQQGNPPSASRALCRPSGSETSGRPAVKHVAGSQLDAVGLLQLLDPVVLDGDAVPRGQLVVLPGVGTILVRQDGRQLLEVGFQP